MNLDLELDLDLDLDLSPSPSPGLVIHHHIRPKQSARPGPGSPSGGPDEKPREEPGEMPEVGKAWRPWKATKRRL